MEKKTWEEVKSVAKDEIQSKNYISQFNEMSELMRIVCDLVSIVIAIMFLSLHRLAYDYVMFWVFFFPSPFDGAMHSWCFCVLAGWLAGLVYQHISKWCIEVRNRRIESIQLCCKMFFFSF